MQRSKRSLVISLARQVRDWTEQRDDQREHPTGDLKGWCAIASAQLSRSFAKNGIDNSIHVWEGDGGVCHVFLVVDEHVIDVTATQFKQLKSERVVIMHVERASAYYFYSTSKVFKDADALREYQRKIGWPTWQTAYKSYVNM